MKLGALQPAIVLLSALSADAAVYAIDIDSTRTSGTTTSGVVDTAAGFNSLDATNGGSAAVSVGGINFELFTVGTNASRRRNLGTPGPGGNGTSLTRDFVFEDAPGAAVGILIGGAGSLPAGDYQVEVWSWDENPNAIDPVFVAYRRNGVEFIQTSSFGGHATDPYSFTLTSDGIGAYDIFVRENNDTNNRSRLNAIRITTIPEPSAWMLGLIGVVGGMFRRRR